MWWKIYFWFYLVLMIGGSLALFVNPTTFKVGEYLEIFIYILGAVGVFAVAHNKNILSPKLWRIYFWIYIGWWVINFADAFGFIDLPRFIMPARSTEFLGVSVGLILSIPVFYALNKLRY